MFLEDFPLLHKQQHLIYGWRQAGLKKQDVYLMHLKYSLFAHLILILGFASCQLLLESSDTAFWRALCSVDRYCWVNLVTVDSIDWNFASSFPSSCDWLLKRLKALGRFITQKLQKKKMFLEGDSNITNSLCLILTQALCSHCSHQQHTMHSFIR